VGPKVFLAKGANSRCEEVELEDRGTSGELAITAAVGARAG
jgi:hypothetical protein